MSPFRSKRWFISCSLFNYLGFCAVIAIPTLALATEEIPTQRSGDGEPVLINSDWSDKVSPVAKDEVSRDAVTKLLVGLDCGSDKNDFDKAECVSQIVKHIGRISDGNIKVTKTFNAFSMAAVELVGLNNLKALARQEKVAWIYENRRYQPGVLQSLPLIKQPDAQSKRFTGVSRAVAVIDSGVNYTHADFGSCLRADDSCKVKVALDFDSDPNDRDGDDNGHGTNVAAIVARVAPGASILALDVWSSNKGTKGGFYLYDIVNALEWVYNNQHKYNIVAVNLSLGSNDIGVRNHGCYSSLNEHRSPPSALAWPISALRNDKKVLTVVASGNEGKTGQMSDPACDVDAVSVGAVYDAAFPAICNSYPSLCTSSGTFNNQATYLNQVKWGPGMGPIHNWGTCTDTNITVDMVPCMVNVDPNLTLLAPGAAISAGGVTMSGTSQAAPHVSGAIAVLSEAFPLYSPTQLVDRLKSTGKPIRVNRLGVDIPRLDLGKAVEGAVPPSAPPSTPPAAYLIPILNMLLQ